MKNKLITIKNYHPGRQAEASQEPITTKSPKGDFPMRTGKAVADGLEREPTTK